MIQSERLHALNDAPPRPGRYVLYWMQASQRAACNHALEYALDRANEAGLPPLVVFGLTDEYPEANLRHHAFMLDGLAETWRALQARGIRLVVRHGPPDQAAAALADAAALLVMDRGYLRHQRRWRAEVARRVACPAVVVETDAVVPVECASTKEEYSAATLRRKLHRALPRFLVPLRERVVARPSLNLPVPGEDWAEGGLDPSAALRRLRVDRAVAPWPGLVGGAGPAARRLEAFADRGLLRYADDRSDPSLEGTSGLSPYLHFGQLSPLAVALRLQAAPAHATAARDAFLEELVVRRELALNYVWYCSAYDRFQGLPAWARRTLEGHEGDPRPYRYDEETLVTAATHDPYWNAAMREMVLTGTMAGYMRMYWGKKLLEWSGTAAEAQATALRLNNRFFVDGRDPNSYAGVAWCLGKHDRPWGERPVFGMVRCMVADGLRRKFDMAAYLARTATLRPGA